MLQQRFHFEKRKSVADFLSENLPNQFLYRCLKANTSLPEETILEAFNEAYTISIAVLAEPDIHTSRSASFPLMAQSASRSSILAHCFVFFLLSFHEKAADLRLYLGNLRNMLEKAIPEIFRPVLLSATSLAPLYPNSVTFQPSSAAAISAQPALNDSQQYVKIQSLMIHAELLPNYEAATVLRVIRATLADESGDWDKILEMAIERILERPEAKNLHSPYHIADRQITNFVKIVRAVFDLRMLKQENGLYVSNFEDFVNSLGDFFNTPIKTPHGLLASAKQAKNYMDVFEKIYQYALDFYEKGDALENTGNKPTIKDRQQALKLPFNET